MGRPADTTPEAYAVTNLFIAFLAGPTHPLHGHARDIMARMDRGELRIVVSPVVVAEVVWAARGALGRSRGSIAALLLEMLESDGFEVTERVVVRRALELQTGHPRLDFADAWLAARATTLGPAAIVSFDVDLDAIEGVTRIAG